MRIAAYLHLHRFTNPTGVGKHLIHMMQGLAGSPNLEITILSPRQHLDAAGQIPADLPVPKLPVISIPWGRRNLETAWSILNRPKIERWHTGADWIYSPVEAYVPSRTARTAATIHCVNWFDPEVPWYRSRGTRSERLRLGPRWRAICSRSTVVLTVSEFLKRRICQLFKVDPARVAVIGNAAEEEYFAVANTPAVISANPYVLVIGGLNQRKGGDYIFPVARELANRDPRFKIKIAGRSEQSYAEKAASYPNIEHIGYRGLDTLPQLLHNSVALLFLSRYDTFGIPAAEALAAGTPAIVSAFAALPEVVGDAGIIADVQRPDTIAEAIVQLHQDSTMRESIIAKGRIRAEQYHWSVPVSRLLETFNKHG